MKKYLMIFVLIISFLLCLPSSVVETFASEVEDNDTCLLTEVEDNDTYLSSEFDSSLDGEEYKLNPNARSFVSVNCGYINKNYTILYHKNRKVIFNENS